MRPCWADWGREEGQAQAGSSREAPSLAKWRWHFQRAAATGGTKEMSLVAFLTRWRAGRRSLRDDKEDRLARSRRRPRPWPRGRSSGCCPPTAFRLGLPPAHALGQGWWGGQRAAGARLALSPSLSQAPANPRAPASTDCAGASRRGQRRRAPRTCRARSASSCAPGHRQPAKSPARRRRQPQELRAPAYLSAS